MPIRNGFRLIRRMTTTHYNELGRHRNYGFLSIIWECSECEHNITLPQQQNISYCPHCGRRISRRTGGSVDPKESYEAAMSARQKQEGGTICHNYRSKSRT